MDIDITRKARSLPPRGCYQCRDVNHLVQDYPHCIDVCQLTSEQQEELIEDLLALKDAVLIKEYPREGRGFCVVQLAISAPWLPVNKFTVLTIENPNTIDSEPVNALPLLLLVPALLRKPKWERRLPKLLFISALDAWGTSLLLPVEIRTMNTSELHSVKALLDSIATRSFIDRDFICLKGINTQTLSRNILVFNVDGSPNKAE